MEPGTKLHPPIHRWQRPRGGFVTARVLCRVCASGVCRRRKRYGGMVYGVVVVCRYACGRWAAAAVQYQQTDRQTTGPRAGQGAGVTLYCRQMTSSPQPDGLPDQTRASQGGLAAVPLHRLATWIFATAPI